MLCLAVLTELMLMLFRRKKFGISNLNLLISLTVIVIFGIIGALVSHYIENGYWGIRYYGTILVVVLALIPTAKIIKFPYNQLMDYVAPQGMLGIIVMKYNCLLKGCCEGKIMHYTPEGIGIVFPSQEVELVTAVLIFVLLLVLENSKRFKNYVFPIFMILYGGTRLFFDYMRAEQGRVFPLGALDISVGCLFCGLIVVFGIMNLYQRNAYGKMKCEIT